MKSTIFLLIILSITMYSQTGKLTGKITEKGTGKPVLAANINFKEIPKGAASVGEGIYVITKIPQGKYTLNFSCKGYENKTVTDVEIKDGETTEMNIELTPVKLKIVKGENVNPDTDLNDKLEKEYLGIIPGEIKDIIQQIKPLDRHTYSHILSQTYFAISSRSSNLSQLLINDRKIDFLKTLELDARSELLGAQYRNVSNKSEKKEIKSKLNTVLKDLFKARRDETKIRLEIMKNEIAEAEKNLNKWIKEEDESIKKRLQYLTEGIYK